MPRRKKTQQRRKAFLLDSNQVQQQRKAPKTVRNRFLNAWFRLKFLRDFGRLITASRMLGMMILCMALFIVFAVFSPYFDLKQIVVSRDDPNIDTEAIESELADFYGQNLLFLDQDLLRNTLEQRFPSFRSIEITEVWPASLSLKIALSEPAFTLQNQSNAEFYVISADGVILSDQPNELLPMIKVYDYTKPLIVGNRFVDQSVLDSAALAEQIMVNQIKIPVVDRLLFPTARELHLVSDRGTVFWLDLQLDAEAQLKKIDYGASKIGLFSRAVEHVDLRIPNQLYWKYAD